MDSLWWIVRAKFLGWILGNCVFCLNEVVELTRAIIITCFIANFLMLLYLFTSNNDCTTHESNFLCTSASFVNPIGFGMTSLTMGSSSTFRITSTFVRMLGNATKVFSIYQSMIFVDLLTFQFASTMSLVSSSTCSAIL